MAIPADYYSYARQRETGGYADPDSAESETSTASGRYQFLDGTAAAVAKAHPELNLQPDWHRNAATAYAGMRAFTEDNARALEANGVPVNRDSLYSAHHFGVGGALRAFSADPSAPASSIFPPEVIKANPYLRTKTVGQITGASPKTGASMATKNLQDDDETVPALSTRAQMGPGVLMSGGAQESPGFDWDAVTRTGASLASITNPDQAKALMATVGTPGEKGYTLQVDHKTGIGLRMNKAGQIVRFQAFNPPPEKTEQNASDKAYDTDTGRGFSEQNKKIAADATASQQALGNIDTLRSALANPNVYQGVGGESVAYMKKLANTIPGLNLEGVADADVAQAMINKLTQESRLLNGGMPGSLSDKDLAFLKGANAGLDKSATANARIIDIYSKLHSANIERNADRVEYLKSKPRLDEGFNTAQATKWAEKKAAADAADRASPAAAPARAPGARPPLSSIFK